MSVSLLVDGWRGCRGPSVGVSVLRDVVDYRTRLLWVFGGFEEAWTQWMQRMERHIDRASDRMRRLSLEDLVSSLDFELDDRSVRWRMCGLLQPERVIRLVQLEELLLPEAGSSSCGYASILAQSLAGWCWWLVVK